MKEKCFHQRLLVSILTILSGLAVVLHLLSHCVPILMVSAGTWIEPFLHNPVVVVAAWSFVPVMFYHMYKDRQLHRENHRLQERIKELEFRLDDMYD
jgi:hypothetical protein